MNKLSPDKREVMLHLSDKADAAIEKYLKPVESVWQPSDFLPSTADLTSFHKELEELQDTAAQMSYDLWVALVADTITEEALPTYESWLAGMDCVDITSQEGWGKWTKRWTAEENRHGDLLNRYLYLSGKIDMRAVEVSTQYLLSDGMDIQAGNDPYRTFVYTSFQEIATNISHRRVASLAKQAGNKILAKICGVIASEEARHAKAYASFIEGIFEVDPSNMMLAFADMMKKKIVMPAHNLREAGVKIGETFAHFSEAAQRIGVYTSQDYVDILRDLLKGWDIANKTDLTAEAAKAQDYVMRLPDRLTRILERHVVGQKEYAYSWVL